MSLQTSVNHPSRPLGRGHVCFAGFSERLIDASLATVELRLDRTPGVMRLTDVVMFPKQDALYDRTGVRIDESLGTWLDGRQAIADAKSGLEDAEAPPVMDVPDSMERCDRPAFFLGRRHQHYGHLITDGLARAWALSQAPRRSVLVLALLRAADLAAEPARTLFAALGANPQRFGLFKRPVLFSELILPLPALQRGRVIYDGYDRPHRRIGRRLTFGYRNRDLDRPVYLSRDGYGGSMHEATGEAQLQALLEREGYLVIHPETLSLRDQIYLFQQRRPLVASLGSAMHTALFRTGWGSKPLALLTRSTIKGRYLIADALRPVATTFINCITETRLDDHRDQPGQARRFDLNVERAMDFLSSSGFLPGR